MTAVPPPSALPSFISVTSTTGPGPQSQAYTLHTASPLHPSAAATVVVKPLPIAPVPSISATNQIRDVSKNFSALAINPPLPNSDPNAVNLACAAVGANVMPVTANVTFSSASQGVSSYPVQTAVETSASKGQKPVTCQPKPPGPGTLEESSSGFGCDDDGVENKDWMGWLKGTVSSVSRKVAQKAKVSMDSMITTLDPQMKEFLNSGGDMDLVVASDKEVKISPVREAFQHVFGKATVIGIAPGEAGSVANQPFGLEACVAAAEQRINSVRESSQLLHPSLPVLAIESCVAELTPGCYYELAALLLDDPFHDVILQTFTQTTSIPSEWVSALRSGTPVDYPLLSTGFAITVGQVAADNLSVPRGAWHEHWCGVSRREMLFSAARSLASLYRSKLPQQ